jgi:hypothetical protein
MGVLGVVIVMLFGFRIIEQRTLMKRDLCAQQLVLPLSFCACGA